MSLTQEDKQWITGQLEGIEARMMAAFRDWSLSRELRLQSEAAGIRAIEAELEELRQKVEKLEKKRAA